MDEDDHHKEVYAHFGLAIYAVQVLEAGLMNALIFLDFFAKNAGHIKMQSEWSEKHDAFESKQIKEPMGNLMRSLRKLTPVSSDLENQLTTALRHRNFLLHRYFQEHSVRFMDEDGRSLMIADFERYIEEFQKATRMVDALVEPLYEKYGFTVEAQARARREMEEEYQSSKQ